MSYMLLIYPTGNDSYVCKGEGGAPKEFETIDEAVKDGMRYGTDDFWVITKHEWKAVENE